MAKTTPIRTAGLAGLLVLACAIPWQAGMAGGAIISEPPMQAIQIAASDAGSRQVMLGIGKSLVIDLPRDIKDVLVADPTIANAVVRSSRRAYIIGIKSGPDQRLFFRCRRQADGRLRHRGHARSQWHSRCDQASHSGCRHQC